MSNEAKQMLKNPIIVRALREYFNRIEKQVLSNLAKKGMYPK